MQRFFSHFILLLLFSILWILSLQAFSFRAFAGTAVVAGGTGGTGGGGACRPLGKQCGQSSMGANFGYCVTTPCANAPIGYAHSNNSHDDTQCGNNAICVVPKYTCAGQSGVNSNGSCVGYGNDCAGQQEITTSKQTCINQFNQNGYNGTDIKCCSATTNASGTPTVPSASVPNPCPFNKCDTVIGIIDVSSGSAFVAALFRVLLSLSGSIALLLIIYSGYNLSLSQGNPEKIKAAQETLTSAIIGLVFIILSTTILQVIGVDILGIFQK